MKKIIILYLLVLTPFIFSFNHIYAQQKENIIEYNLPYPGILPTHPLYFLKNIRDKILIFMTRDAVKKIEVQLLISDKKLVMGRELMAGDSDESRKKGVDILTEAENGLLKTINNISNLSKIKKAPPGLLDKIDLSVKKHREVIENITESKKAVNDQKLIEELEVIQNINNQAKSETLMQKY